MATKSLRSELPSCCRTQLPARPSGVRILGITLATVALAGCGSSANGGLTGGPSGESASGTSASAPPLVTHSRTTVSELHFAAMDSVGDRVNIRIAIGAPVPAATVTDPSVQACGPALSSNGSTVARSAALPVSVSSRLTSDSAISVEVDFGEDLGEIETNGVYDGGTVIPPANPHQDPLTNPPTLWATTYSTAGPQCTSLPDTGAGVWAALTEQLSPNQTQSWQSWLVVPEQITPDGPPLSSPDSAVSHFIFYPRVSIGQTEVSVTDPSSPTNSYAACPDGKSYLEANPSVASTEGCTGGAKTPPTTGGSTKSQASGGSLGFTPPPIISNPNLNIPAQSLSGASAGDCTFGQASIGDILDVSVTCGSSFPGSVEVGPNAVDFIAGMSPNTCINTGYGGQSSFECALAADGGRVAASVYGRTRAQARARLQAIAKLIAAAG